MQNSPARSSIDVGSVIADTYTIEALIGRGGMGAVFVASHKRLPGKKVAIKVLHAELSGEEVLARFKREAEIASRLGHPNIVQVHDFNLMADGTPYLVLEYLHGESLAQRLKAGPLAIEPTLSIVRQVGSALAAAHREGIVHRDLKPQNIFLVPTEVDGRVVEIAKVLDFGISKIRGSQTVKTQDSALLGTPQYMAPEQATGQHTLVDERTDVFAFGAIVHEMVSGQPAFSGETIPEVVFKVVYEPPTPLPAHLALPPTIASAVSRAMAKNAAERFANVGEFVEALTGAPLPPARTGGSSIPPPDGGFASGSRAPNTDKEAFAQTMGSGDHGPAPSSQPPTARQQAPLATDATVSAGPGAAQVPSPAGPGPVQVSVPAPSRKKTGAIVAAVIGAAAIAAVVMYIVMRQPPAPPQQVAHVAEPPSRQASADAATPAVATAAPADAVPVVPAEPVDAAPAVATASDAGKAEPAEAKQEPKLPAKTKPDKKDPKPVDPKPDPKPAPSDDDDDDGGDEVAAKKLLEAQQALAASQWDRAESLANAVTTSEDATPRQKIRAALIYGTVQCLARNDEGRARIALRKLAMAPKLRRRLLDACHRAQFLQNER